ncbi:MAG: aspartate/glutamate racemase family protein [Ignavibacteriales bacterium]
MTRILWQNNTNEAPNGVTEFTKVWDVLKRQFKQVARPDTQVELVHLTRSTNNVRSRYGDFVNAAEVVERLVDSEKQGYDAAVIGCMTDSGLYEAREVVSIPVISVAEAAMYVAMLLGQRFAIVTVDSAIVPNMEKLVKLYGLEARSIYRPVRAVEPPLYRADYMEAVTDPYKTAIPRIEEVARECIKDGAEVIIVGCGYLGPILSSHGYRFISGSGAVVVDSAAAALKMAEMMADLRRTAGFEKSRAGYFRPLSDEVVRAIRAAR